nr:YcgJ family protein [Acinetobacter sp. ANC 4648]
MGCQSFSSKQPNSTMEIDLKNPEKKVLCDKYICANSEGVSKELTIKYLGQKQADRIFSQGEFDKTQFTFENGIFCDTNTKTCHVDRYYNERGKHSAIAPKYTSALFGK